MTLLKKYNAIPSSAKAALWYTLCNMIQKAINVLVIPLYTRMLSTAEYGTYSVFISWMEIFEIIVTLRLFYGAYVVGLVKFEEDKYRYTASLEQLTLLITTVFLGLYLLFQNPINQITELTTPLTLIMFIILYAIPIIGFWRAWQRVENQYIQMVVVTLAISVLTPLFGVVSIFLVKANALSVIGARVSVELLVAAALFVICRNQYLQKPSHTYWKYALQMNVPLIPYYLSTVVLNHSDRIIIQRLVGYSEAGIYSVAYSAAMIMTLFSSAFNSSLQPWLYKQLKKENYKNISRMINATLLMIAGMNILLIVFAPEAITILAPKSYHEAIWIVPPLAASVFVMFFYQHFVNVEFYYNDSKITAIASIGAAVLNIVLNIMLIPIFGYLAAGYTTLISYIAFLIAHYVFVKYVCKKNNCPITIFDIRSMLLISACFSVLALLLLFSYGIPLLRYSIFIVGCLCCWIKRKDLIRSIKAMLKGNDL